MTFFITQTELEHLTEPELRSAFNRVSHELHVKRQLWSECHLLLSSLEEIEREMQRRALVSPRR